MSILRKQFAIQRLDLDLDIATRRYFGELIIQMPGGGTIQGSAEILNGQLNSVFFGWTGKQFLYTFSGGSSVYLTALSGGIEHLSVTDNTPLTIRAGILDPNTYFVTQPAGLGLSWGLGVGPLSVDMLTVEGAAIWSTDWHLAAGGALFLFKEQWGNELRMTDISMDYRNSDQLVNIVGVLRFNNLFSVKGKLTTSFKPEDRYYILAARAETKVPTIHWAKMLLPTVSLQAQVAILGRLTPVEKNLLGARAFATIAGFKVSSVDFQYDLRTKKFSDYLDRDLIAVLDSVSLRAAAKAPGILAAAVSQSLKVEIANNKGAEGLVVRLKHTQGIATFNLRRPNGNLITPNDADGANIAFAQNPNAPNAVYLLKSAENGTWQAEFDETGLGQWQIEFFSPGTSAKVFVSAPAQDIEIAVSNVLTTTFASTNIFGSNLTARVLLDSDKTWGGGRIVATASASDVQNLQFSTEGIPPGTYFVCVEIDTDEIIPVFAYAPGKIIVKSDRIGNGTLYPKLGSFKNNGGTSVFTISGNINPTGLPKDIAGVEVNIRINGFDIGSAKLGKNGSSISSTNGIKLKLGSLSGNFLLSATGLDLKAVLGLTDSPISTIADIQLEISGGGIQIPVQSAAIEFSCDRKGQIIVGKFSSPKQRTVTGAFLSLNTTVKQSNSGYKIAARGPLVAPERYLDITGDIRIVIGGHTNTIPAGLLEQTQKAVSYNSRLGAVEGLGQFSINFQNGQFSLISSELLDTGIPQPGHGSNTSRMSLTIEIPTSAGTQRFETIVELQRLKTTAKTWKR